MEKPNVRVVSAAEAKSEFSAIIKHGFARAEHLIVEKSGVPVAAILPMADYQQLVGAPVAVPKPAQKVDEASNRAQARRDLAEFLTRVHAEMPQVDEDEEEVEKFIQQEVDAMRAERAKKMLAESRAKYSTTRHHHSRKRAKK
ncbi:MAG: type II toxin-antitoxin system Phd/YefM family antitoxin [Chloroflexi bacterium]|nr:type II toxin-antitoxin system Phd/YefM family antitoxin [Chloroflexota bacterium]